MGAKGITCQKLGEAEVMIDAGLDDILISYPLVGATKADRLAALSRRAKLRVAVDSALAIETVAAAARASNVPIGILVEFDSGNARTGVISVDRGFGPCNPDRKDAGAAVRRTDDLSQHRRDGGVRRRAPGSGSRKAGIGIAVVSGGGTPNAWQAHQIAGLTEVRVGTYIYQDRATVAAGAAELDECALHVHATVISRPTPDRAVIDAGSKSLVQRPGGSGRRHRLWPDPRL